MPHTQFLEALSDAAILTDPAGIVRSWNHAATRLFGWTASEMIGRPLVERFPVTARAEVNEHLRQLAAGAEWDGEFQDFRKDGNRVWVEAHVHPVRAPSGEVTGILGVSREISAEGALAVERERHDRSAADILNSMSAHVAVLGSDGRIREVNRAWEQFASENTPGGKAPESTCVGIDYVGLCRACIGEKADEAGPAADGIVDVMQGKRSFFVLEYPCDSPTESRWFAMHVTPLKSSGGGGAVVAHYDITARKRAEIAAATQRRWADLALTTAHMGLWTLDLASGRIEWSEEVHKIVGVTQFDGTLEAWTRLVHPEDLPTMQARFVEALGRRMPFTGEFRIVRPDGETRWLANVAHVECAPTGEAVAVVGTVQDITARKRSEWALTAYNQILELIAAGADLHRILERVVGLVEEQLPGSLCSLLIVDSVTGQLRFGAGPSLPADYNSAVDGVTIGPKSGSCGTAAFRKKTVTVTDIATDPLWEDYRDLALRHGLKSCVSVPIFSSGNVPGHEKGSVIGTFALYNRTSGDFDRLTYAILTGAQQLAERALQTEREQDSARVFEATHLAGVAIERNQAEHAIRESEARFRAVFDSAPSAIYIKDLNGYYLFVNHAMVTFFGLSDGDWVGKRSRELLPGHLAELCERSEQRALAAQHPVEDRMTCKFPNGRETTVQTTHMVLRKGGGLPYATCGLLRDITDLVAAQQEFERLWLYAPDPLCVAGFDGHFKQLNPAWSRLLGWTDEELLRKPYSEFVHPDDRVGLVDMERRIIRGETVLGYENRYRCRDGSYRWFSWNAIPVLEDRVIYGITRDVTEEKRLAEQFRQAQKMEAIGQLASGVAHDFNNLLTVINGYTELILDGTPADDPNRASLTEVQEAGQRAKELTSQLLAFSRKAIVEPKVLDVNRVIESSTRLLRRLIGEGILLEMTLADVSPVKIDPGQLEQVLMNLAVNARDAMPDGGRLSISTERVDSPENPGAESGASSPVPGVLLRVKDTGTGMTPEVQSRIFEPFFTTKGPGRGTGLGLATVYGIVRQAAGSISVVSKLGVGTTFDIILPGVSEATVGPLATRTGVGEKGFETILLVEDEAGVRNVARVILARQGYTVLAASNAKEALKIAANYAGRIDLLLTDLVMPGMGGRGLAEKLCGQRVGIRVLYMSGYTDDEVLRSGIASSQEPFIQKPFTPFSLSTRVREVLDAVASKRPSMVKMTHGATDPAEESGKG